MAFKTSYAKEPSTGSTNCVACSAQEKLQLPGYPGKTEKGNHE